MYVDDILVASETADACREDSLALLHHMSKTGNKVNKNKMQWVQHEVNYLGHTLNAAGIKIQQLPKQAIAETPKLKQRNK